MPKRAAPDGLLLLLPSPVANSDGAARPRATIETAANLAGAPMVVDVDTYFMSPT